MTERSTREEAAVLVEHIMDRGAYSHIALRDTLDRRQDLSGQDRAFLSRMVTGTVERCLFLDDVINRISKTPVRKMKPFIRAVMRISAYQILFMDGVQDRAACNEAVNLVKKRGFGALTGFANGVLRNLSRRQAELTDLSGIRDAVRALSLSYSMPEWIVSRWCAAFSADTAETMLKGLMEEPPLTVRVNESLTSVEQVQVSLQAQGVEGTECSFLSGSLLLSGVERPDMLESFRKGWIQIQDLSSQMAGFLAAPVPGELVLDVCAAPGGKTIHVADLLRGRGRVLACDLTERKTSMIREHVDRTGFSHVTSLVHDARVFRPEWEEQADLVIADLPCSGLGVMGRKPEIRYRMDEAQILSLQQLQREILAVVSRYVRPGGRLLYSTCTVTAEENMENAGWITENLPFEPVDFSGRVPQPLKSGLSGTGCLQLLPGVHPCDGFFVSLFRKNKDMI